MAVEEMIPELVVFDFDETIVDCNSDTFINELAPGGKIPREIWDVYLNENDWTVYMQQVFRYLHQMGKGEADYRECLAKMPLVEGMKKLMRHLASPPSELKKHFEVVIISDANSFFIKHSLEVNGLADVVKKVFTNPAHFDPNGCLCIERFHEQNWCSLSARNLCKGHVLKDYIMRRASEGVKFDRVSYVGDGANDLCPSIKLSHADCIFPRAEFKLHKLLCERQVAATVHPFRSALDIWQVLCH